MMLKTICLTIAHCDLTASLSNMVIHLLVTYIKYAFFSHLLCNHLIDTKLHNRIYFLHYYKGNKVVLHKRAQILVADLWQLFEGKGLCNFSDIDGITMFADYRVPQSLQYFGAFQYSESLFQDLKNEKLLGEYVPA